MATDRRFADYTYWTCIYPSMPNTKLVKTIQFEAIFDRTFELVSTRGSLELRWRRQDATDHVCDGIAEAVSQQER